LNIRRIFVLFTTLALFALLFVGGPDGNAERSLREFWNLGHIGLFLALGYLMLSPPSPLARRTFTMQFLAVVSLTLLLGGLVELVQSRIGRDMDLVDMARNSVGALLSLAFLAPGRLSLARTARHSLQATALLLLAGTSTPFAMAVWDEEQALKEWPELANFESSLELGRWSSTGATRLSIDNTVALKGGHAMRVELGTSKYAGASLDYFPRDWSAYERLIINLYNPAASQLTVTCRIHDRAHSQSSVQEFSDRFNRTYQLMPGWNQITISLQDLANAPTGRSMDTQLIDGLQIFVSGLASPATIYIDDIYLADPAPVIPDES